MIETFTAKSHPGEHAPPPIEFRFEGDTVRAELEGAHLYGELRADARADLRVEAADKTVLADIVVNPLGIGIAQTVVDVGSALMWSHWRHTQALAAMDLHRDGSDSVGPCNDPRCCYPTRDMQKNGEVPS